MKNYEQKVREAMSRRVAYDVLTVQQKLAKLDAAGLTASRERSKLNKLLEASKNVEESKSPGKSTGESQVNVEGRTKTGRNPKHWNS